MATPYGVFQIYYTGRRVAQATLLTNKELGGTTKGFQVEDGGTQVTQVEVLNYRVDNGVDTGHGPTAGVLKCWVLRSRTKARPKSGTSTKGSKTAARFRSSASRPTASTRRACNRSLAISPSCMGLDLGSAHV